MQHLLFAFIVFVVLVVVFFFFCSFILPNRFSKFIERFHSLLKCPSDFMIFQLCYCHCYYCYYCCYCCCYRCCSVTGVVCMLLPSLIRLSLTFAISLGKYFSMEPDNSSACHFYLLKYLFIFFFVRKIYFKCTAATAAPIRCVCHS